MFKSWPTSTARRSASEWDAMYNQRKISQQRASQLTIVERYSCAPQFWQGLTQSVYLRPPSSVQWVSLPNVAQRSYPPEGPSVLAPPGGCARFLCVHDHWQGAMPCSPMSQGGLHKEETKGSSAHIFIPTVHIQGTGYQKRF